MAITDQIISMTEKVYIPKAIDNIFDSNFLLKRMRQRQKRFTGGTKIAQPLEYDNLPSSGSFTGNELLDTTLGEVVTLAEYEWRQYYVTLGWTRRDFLINQGSEQQIVNLVSTITKNASKTMQRNLTTGFFQATKANSTDIDGFIVSGFAAGSTSVGGLTSSDITTWAPQRDTSTTALSLAAMNTLWRAANDGPDAITAIVTTDDVLGFYYNIATPLQRYTGLTADQGFTAQGLTFNGVPVFTDKNCNAKHMYMMNEDHFWLAAHTMEDMRFQRPQVPLDQATSIGQIFWMGNIIWDSRRRQAVFTALVS